MTRLINEQSGHRSLLLVCATTAFLLGLGGTALGLLPRVNVTLEAGGPVASESRYSPSYSARTGRELPLVFIGSSTCMWSNDESLPAVIENLEARVGAAARASGRSFAAVGVARDWDVLAGVRHLASFGQFDEILVGRGWLNSGVLKYVWKDFPGTPATPQVLVVDRFVRAERGIDRGLPYDVDDERLVIRKVGLDEIRLWSSNGAPLPALSTDAPQ